MNKTKRACLCVLLTCGLMLGLVASVAAERVSGTVKAYQASDEEFVALKNSVVALLKTRDTTNFAKEVTPSIEDWNRLVPTNSTQSGFDRGSIPGSVRGQQGRVEPTAKAFVGRLELLHLDLSKADLRMRVVRPTSVGTTYFAAFQAQQGAVPRLEKLDLVFDLGTNAAVAGEFRLSLNNLIKFPGGWRVFEGIRWEGFPADVGDEKVMRQIALLNKASNHEQIDGKDDPALLDFGERVVAFLRTGDTNGFVTNTMITSDLAWALSQKAGYVRSREELDREIGSTVQEETLRAQAMLSVLQDAGISLRDADIQVTGVMARIGRQGDPNSLDDLLGDGVKVMFKVKSDGRSKNGSSISGDYVVAANQIIRFKDNWRLSLNLRLEKLPPGLVDSKVNETIELDNYVTEHGALPPKMAAPEIEFITLDGEKKMKLSDLHGKVVVLDFWATWCGPCQGPMADLQKLRSAHTNWGDKVAIIPLSIDDDMKTVRQHVAKRGWTNTMNVWAEEGGWRSGPAKAFHVNSVPTTYIIDAEGKIVFGGHAAGMTIDNVVDDVLKKGKEWGARSIGDR